MTARSTECFTDIYICILFRLSCLDCQSAHIFSTFPNLPIFPCLTLIVCVEVDCRSRTEVQCVLTTSTGNWPSPTSTSGPGHGQDHFSSHIMISTWSRGKADDNMPEDILVDLFDIVHRHPWWKARASFAIELLKKHGVRPPQAVLDAGCGWGVNLKALSKHGYRMAGLDISRQVLQRLDRHYRDLIEADLTQDIPEAVQTYNAVLALDVIEHVDDDRAVVSRLGKLIGPGGVVIVSVPALPELYSEFDAVQGHRRRYIPDTLRQAFTNTGLRVEQLLWWGDYLLPLVRWQRRRLRVDATLSLAEKYRRYLATPPWPFSLMVRFLYQLEQRQALKSQSKCGSSLFAIARKQS